jgi:hypothetical protein
MCQIVVMTDVEDEAQRTVLLSEHVDPGELESDDICARLVERVGWAIVEADEVEQIGEHEAGVPTVQPSRRNA